jgi:hypothetical protein
MKATLIRTSFAGLLLAGAVFTQSSASATTNAPKPNVVVAEGGNHAACPNCGHAAPVAPPAVAAVRPKRFGFLSLRRGTPTPKVDHVVTAAGAALNAAYDLSPHAAQQKAVQQAKVERTQKVEALRPAFRRLTGSSGYALGTMMYKLGYAHVDNRYGSLSVYHRNREKYGIPVMESGEASLWILPRYDGQLNFIFHKNGKATLVRDFAKDHKSGRSYVEQATDWSEVVTHFPTLDTATVNNAIAKFTETAKHEAAALPAR